MGTFGIWHILIFATVALVLFGGRGKVSDLMGDFGRGINSFKKGLNDPDKDPPKIIHSERTETAAEDTDTSSTNRG
jgi:sec-independent protein translocase protein TatA